MKLNAAGDWRLEAGVRKTRSRLRDQLRLRALRRFCPDLRSPACSLEPDPHYPKSAGLIDRGVFGRTR